jgi:hypothetical protein
MWQEFFLVTMVAGIVYYSVNFRKLWAGEEDVRATKLALEPEKSMDVFFILIPASVFPVLGTLFMHLDWQFLMSLSFNLALAYWLIFLLGINRLVGDGE